MTGQGGLFPGSLVDGLLSDLGQELLAAPELSEWLTSVTTGEHGAFEWRASPSLSPLPTTTYRGRPAEQCQ